MCILLQIVCQVCRLEEFKQESQLSLGWADCIAYIQRPASDFQLRKESDFLECLQFHTLCWCCYIECYSQC